jgi:hypothetical protein
MRERRMVLEDPVLKFEKKKECVHRRIAMTLNAFAAVIKIARSQQCHSSMHCKNLVKDGVP